MKPLPPFSRPSVRRRRRKAERSQGVEPLTAILGRSRMKTGGGSDRFDVTPVAPEVWREAVGVRIAAKTRPYRLEGGTLWVRAASATWAQELSLLSVSIVSALEQAGLTVKQLRFSVGSIDRSPRTFERTVRKQEPPLAPLPESVALELMHVQDDGLRQTLERAIRRNLGWQQSRAEIDEPPGPRSTDVGATKGSPIEGSPTEESPIEASSVARAPRDAEG